jgi:L-ascorbate metabolism protein UlaG (beta-lactamase superfamily)
VAPGADPRRNRLAVLAVAALFLVPPLLAFAASLLPFARRAAGGEAVHFGPPPRDAIAFWGHSSLYIDVGGVGLAIDPVFDAAYAPTCRRTVGAPDREACRGAALVLVSHAHADHLSPRSLALFPDTARVLCPAKCVRYLDDGRSFKVLEPWEEFRLGEIAVVAVPARHPGGRYALRDRENAGALGYVIRAPGRTIYYSGDTEPFDGFAEIGRRFHPDIAILNVNVHLPAAAVGLLLDWRRMVG